MQYRSIKYDQIKQAILSIIIVHYVCANLHAVAPHPMPELIQGSYPQELDYLKGQIKSINQCIKTQPDFTKCQAHNTYNNRYILKGPPGNGKSTLIRKIAQESGSQLFELPGPNIVKKNVGDGPDNINAIFNAAISHIMDKKQTAIIMIDEIDAIGTEYKEDWHSEHKASLQALWLNLDTYKKDPRIILMSATNCFEKLNKAFIDRFGNNVFEIKNPDIKVRVYAIDFFTKKNQVNFNWSMQQWSELAKKTEGLSMRSIEDFIDAVFINARARDDKTIYMDHVLGLLDKIKKRNELEKKPTAEEIAQQNLELQKKQEEIARQGLELQKDQSKKAESAQTTEHWKWGTGLAVSAAIAYFSHK
jgi:SpoVK/Ycf46/Vps4 family AAA+-type ATPase